MTLQGKTALVTGASRGIGRAIALAFAKEGANVAVIYAGSRQAADEVCAQAAKYGIQARAYQCDVTDFDRVKETVQAVQKDLGGVDILVNNAGITRDGLVYTMKEADFDAVLNTNLKGAFHSVKHCYPIFVKKRAGKIINISSVCGLMGNGGQANYSASKAGIIGFSKTVAKEYASRNIRVNVVAPGFIDTKMTRANKELLEGKYLQHIPMGRFGQPEDVAHAVTYLASDLASYVTGKVLTVDGGMTM
ncbi:MAG TPA: 3-oxoacyl-[acyl-carrier-protein] reductase [Ruminococcaceae bacterium]|nr:3-oxoacyl-[acyl-carrier-protein] reductase [Oscillospiraceae bacterium]